MSDRSVLSVLVVEDNPADSRLIVEELADQPDPVAVETNGSIESALDLLAKRRFDCVLVCHDLLAAHEADGLAAFGAAAAPAPVIVLVEYSDAEAMLSTLQAGADDCYRKAGLKGGDLLWSMRLSIARRSGNAVGTRAESELDQFTRVVGPVFDALPVATAAVDPEGAVVLWSRTSEELVGRRGRRQPAPDDLGS
jgi:CheY-like chemotaxis protein